MHKVFRISTLAMLALGATALTAQAQGAKSFGIVAGVDFATITGSDAEEFGSKTGFIGGLYLSIPMSASLAIEPEVLYASKGGHADAFDVTISNNYIEIPVLFKYSFKPAGGPYLLAGPAVGFSISCNAHDDTDEVDCADTGLEDNTTFGGVVGIGFQKNRFGLEGRYDFDFGNAWKDVEAKNAVWEVLARIMIK